MFGLVVPILGGLLYVHVTNVLREIFIKNREVNSQNVICKVVKNAEKPFSIIHNAALVVFSGWTFWKINSAIMQQGFVFKSMYWFNQHELDTVIGLFYASKYYEFIDTFLIIVKGREPSFLQKFHHIGAMLSWYFCYTYKVDAIVYGTWLNSFVHTVMYTYFCLSTVGIRLTFIRPVITSVQLAQFVVGNLIGSIYYIPPNENLYRYLIILAVDFYLVGLIYLFGEFFSREYVSPGVRSSV
jgi:hypothetical protein